MMREIFLLWVCLAVVLCACGRAESFEIKGKKEKRTITAREVRSMGW